MWLLLMACGGPAAPDPADLEAQRKALHEELRRLVGDLGKAGKYDCCVEAPCTMCAMRVGGCKCGEGLRNGEPVCEECAMMWRQGKGAEPGVEPDSVRTFLEAEKEMTSKAHGEKCACGGE